MSVAIFEKCLVAHGDRSAAPGVKIKCDKCGYEAREYFSRKMQGPPDEGVDERRAARKFEAVGWKVGTSRKQHRCPHCVKDGRAAQMRFLHAKKENPVSNVVELPRAEPPPEMKREDRRIIFVKLEEVYGDEKTGYRAGWTDEKVSNDLGVPRQWVATVRDENFGPIASNPEIDALIAEARSWRTEAANLGTEGAAISQKFERFLTEVRTLNSKAELIERKLFAMEKAVRP